MRDPNNFKDQVANLMDNHEGMSLILEYYGVSSDTAANVLYSKAYGKCTEETFDTAYKDFKEECLRLLQEK